MLFIRYLLVAASPVKHEGVTDGSGPRINLSLRTVSRLEEVFGSLHIKQSNRYGRKYGSDRGRFRILGIDSDKKLPNKAADRCNRWLSSCKLFGYDTINSIAEHE